jgi:hypothetical protein
MAHAYTPGLKVSPKIQLTKKRILPLKGDVLVKVGDKVTSDMAVARTELPGKVTPINAANILGVAAADLPDHVLKAVGDPLKKAEVYAMAKSFFGLFKTTLKAPEQSTLESVSNITGKILLRGNPLPVEVMAYLNGTITEVFPNEGVAVQCWAAFAQGIFGIGGETHGKIKMACVSASERLTPEKISAEHKDTVLVGGSIVTAAALKKALENGVRAIVVGGFDDQDLRNFLGYDLGVAITGSENKGITLVVTEGFGEIPMAERTFDLMKSHEGHMACVNGATQIRAGVIRPEVVIPRQEGELVSVEDVKAGALQPGTPVRVIREPYFGHLGTVSGLPTGLTPLESETKARILKVKFPDGKEAIVPRANVEILET